MPLEANLAIHATADLPIIHPAGDVIHNVIKNTQHYSRSSIVVVKGDIPY